MGKCTNTILKHLFICLFSYCKNSSDGKCLVCLLFNQWLLSCKQAHFSPFSFSLCTASNIKCGMLLLNKYSFFVSVFQWPCTGNPLCTTWPSSHVLAAAHPPRAGVPPLCWTGAKLWVRTSQRSPVYPARPATLRLHQNLWMLVTSHRLLSKKLSAVQDNMKHNITMLHLAN